jgi:hypothetical protein
MSSSTATTSSSAAANAAPAEACANASKVSGSTPAEEKTKEYPPKEAWKHPKPANKRSGKDQTVQITDLYTIGRVIDGGANGQVLEGQDKRTGEKVAIKKIVIGAGSNENEGQMEIWAQVAAHFE